MLLRLFEIFYESNGAPTGAAVAPPPAGPDPALVAAQNQNLLLQLQNSRLQALADFPQADREILEMVQGTPEEIRSAAEKMHVKAVAAATTAQAAAPPVAPPVAAPAAATAPVPAPGPGAAAPPEDQSSVEQRRLRLQVKSPALRKTIEPVILEEFFSNEWNTGWNKHIAERKATAGRTS
jgi:hypothetical protein